MPLGAGAGQPAATSDSGRAPDSFRWSLRRSWLIALGLIPVSLRRSLGLPWLIALLAVPLLIAAIGYGALDRPPRTNGPTGALPTLKSNTSAAPRLSLAPFSIARDGNDVVLGGDLPDDPTKAALLRALTGSLGPGMNILDHVNVDPNVDSLDFSNAGPLFNDSAPIVDFHFTVDDGTITLAGTAASQDQKNKVEHDAVTTWSGLKVVDNLVVRIGNGPAAARAEPCADLQSAIDTAMGGPITFASDGFGLTPADEQTLTQVADKLKACPGAQATINGYSDDAGAEPVNIAMSSQRAQRVADFLNAHGVAADRLVVKGFGSVNPVAGNDTAVGRARNRRVEIAVG